MERRSPRKHEMALLVSNDIADLKHTRDVLETVFDAAPSWLGYLDRDLHFVYANRAYAEAAGYTQASLHGKSFEELFPEELVKVVREVRDRGKPFIYREAPAIRPLTRPDSPVDYVDAYLIPVTNARGEVEGIVTWVVDVTDKVRQRQRVEAAEQEQARQNQLLEMIQAATSSALIHVDRELRFLYVNAAAERLMQRPREEILGHTGPELFPKAGVIREAAARVLRTGEEERLTEVRVPLPKGVEGEEQRLDITLTPVFAAEREVEGLVISIMDVTEKVEQRERTRAAERARAQQASVLEMIQEAVPSAVVHFDRHLRFAYVNAAAVRMIGLSPQEIIGRSPHELFPDLAPLKEVAEHILETGEEVEMTEVPITVPRGPTGQVRRFDMTLAPARGPEGAIDGLVVSATDVTEKVEHRERTLEAERERAQLAENLNNEIAHRVKNNLAMVSGLLQMQMHLHPEPELSELLRDAITRVRTFAHIHEQMYTAGREQLDICESMQRLAKTVQEVYGTTTPMTVTVEGDHPEYRSRAVTNLTIVANELLTNAVKHGRPEEDGTVHIDLRVRSGEGLLRVTIWNSGATLPEGFDPAQHRSMGLRLVWDVVVEQYGGRLELTRRDEGVLAVVEVEEAALARS